MHDGSRQAVPSGTVVLMFRLTPAMANFVRLLAGLGIETIYFDPVGTMRTPDTMMKLAAAGIRQIDYAALPDFDAYARHKVLARWSEAAVAALFPDEVAERAAKELPPVRNGRAKLQAMVNDLVAQSLRPYSTMGAVAEYLRARGVRCLIWPLPGVWSAILFARFAKLPTLLPATLVAVCFDAMRFAGKIFGRLNKAPVASLSGPGMTAMEIGPSVKPRMNAEVLMFAHQGLKYGNLFTKDQYYAADLHSPLACERICHVEIAGTIPDSTRTEIMSSYRDAGVAPFILSMPPLAGSHGRWLGAAARGRRLGLGLLASVILEAIRARVVRGIAALAAFPSARLALLGYEFLFPPWLAYALQARGIRVAATQERLMQASLPGLTLILDEYFVHGEAAVRALKANPFICIDHIEPVGDVRASELKRNSRYESVVPQGFRHVTMVLDWHSEPHAIESAQHPTNGWANNKLFYRDIIALARRFPSSFFIVRGKNADWLKIPEFDDIRCEMEALPNITVSKDYARPLVSYELAAISDSVIARYTSLGDQCMAVGKPVIYHDGAANGGPLVRSVFNFGDHPVLANDSESLNKLYASLMDRGVLMPEGERAEMVRYYFNAPLPPGGAKATVVARLEALLQ